PGGQPKLSALSGECGIKPFEALAESRNPRGLAHFDCFRCKQSLGHVRELVAPCFNLDFELAPFVGLSPSRGLDALLHPLKLAFEPMHVAIHFLFSPLARTSDRR